MSMYCYVNFKDSLADAPRRSECTFKLKAGFGTFPEGFTVEQEEVVCRIQKRQIHRTG